MSLTTSETLPPDEDFHWDVISTYSRAEAIADGILIDVTQVAKEAGFNFPVALTNTAWIDCVEWTDEDRTRRACQNQDGRLWDVVWMAALAARANSNTDCVVFGLHRVSRDSSSVVPVLVNLLMHIGPGDTAAPVITIGFPGDF